MFVPSEKSKKMLYPPEIDNSEILEITNEKSVVYIDTFNENQDPALRAEIVSKDYIKYRFYFAVDMKEAIRKGIRKVVFSIRKDLQQSENNVFGSASTSEEILEAVYSYETDNKENIRADDLQGLLYRQNVNIMKVMNDEKTNLINASDAAKFGIIQKVKTVNPKKWKKLKKKLRLAQHPSNTIDKRLVGSGTPVDCYLRCISSGIDPGTIYSQSSGFSPADPKKNGSYVSKPTATGNIYIDALRNTMMENTIPAGDQPSVFDSSRMDSSPGDTAVAIVESKVNRIMLVPIDVKIPASLISGMPTLMLTIDAPDRHGLINERLNLVVDNSQNVIDYYTPRKPLDIIAGSSFMSPDNNITLEVKRNDKNIRSCRIFYRKINESRPLSSSKFKLLDTKHFYKRDTISTVFNIGDFSKSTLIFRVVPVSFNGISYGNFSSSVFKRSNFTPVTGVINTMTEKGSVSIIFSNGSSNIIAVKFLKRDITANEKNFKSVIDIIPEDNDPTIDYTKIGGLSNRVDKTGSCSAIDRDVRQNHTYEYKAVLYLKSGVQRITNFSRIQKYVEPIDVVKLVATTVSKTQSSRTFQVQFSIPSTETETIISSLSAAGLADLYSGDIAALKSSLHDAIIIGVERLDMSTGETNYIGYFSPGTIVDNGSFGKNPSMSKEYKYRFTAYIIAPQVAMTDLIYENQDPEVPTVTQLIDIRSPRNLQTMRQKAIASLNMDVSIESSASKFVADKTVKAFSTAGLVKGTVVSPEKSFASKVVAKYSPEKFSTGVYSDVNTSSRKSIDVNSSKISLGRHGNILSWSTSSSQSKSLDYFIVLAQKQGRKNISGTCFKSEINGYYRFIDYENKDYVGVVSYTVIPISLSGAVGEEYLIGSTIMTDKSKTFRRTR